MISTRRPLDLGTLGRVLALVPLWVAVGWLLLPIADTYRLGRVESGMPFEYRQLSMTRWRELVGALAPSPLPPPDSSLPLVELGLDPRDLARLTSDLPWSGRTAVPGRIKTAAGPIEVEARLRGDHAYHWFFPKRSWSVETKQGEPLALGQRLAFINPPERNLLNRWVAWTLARRMGLLSSPARPARLALNGKDHGVYVLQLALDAAWLAAMGEPRGAIFSGDASWGANAAEDDYFVQPYAWLRDAPKRLAPEAAIERTKLADVLAAINGGTYWTGNARWIDEPYMARFCAFTSLLGSTNIDTSHNVRLLHDGISGRFKMIDWDSGIGEELGLDIVTNPLFLELLREGGFALARDRAIHALLSTPGATESFLAEIKAMVARLAPHVARDRREDASFNLDDQRFEIGGAALVAKLEARIVALREALGDARLAWIANPDRIAIDSHGQVAARATLAFDRAVRDGLVVLLEADGDGEPSEGDRAVPWSRTSPSEVALELDLHPGRRRVATPHYRSWILEPAPLAHLLHLQGAEGATVVAIRGTSAVDGTAARVDARRDWVAARSDRVDPVALPREPQGVVRFAAGEHEVSQTVVIGPRQVLEIEPGATLRLGPRVSIHVRGRLDARGTAAAPIRIERANASAPWGALVLQGPGASGSALAHAVVTGGSLARLDGAAYSAMVAIADAGQVSIEHCRFGGARLGEACLWVTRAEASVRNCTFDDDAADALSYYLATGAIERTAIARSGNDAIDIAGGSVVVSGVEIDTAGDKGISIGERARVVVRGARIRHAAIGLQVRDGAEAIVADGAIEACPVGIDLATDRWEYAAGGTAELYRVTVERCPVARRVDARSALFDGDGTAADRALDGMLGSFAALRQVAAVTEDRFLEDFTTDHRGWTASGAMAAAPRKVRDALVVRKRGGDALVLARDFDPPLDLAHGGVVAVDLAARSGARVRIAIVRADGSAADAVDAGEVAPGLPTMGDHVPGADQRAWARVFRAVAPGIVRRIELIVEGPAGEIALRRVAVRGLYGAGD